MGVIYFFAGFWKFVIGGITWGTGETMKDILYAQWFRLDWMPFFRIDQYPFICKISGLGVMSFELAFIFRSFYSEAAKICGDRRTSFSPLVYLFAHINFWNLAVCYIVFLDFEPFYRRLIKKPGTDEGRECHIIHREP